MTPLRYTVRGDGPSDAMLVPILDWLLRRALPAVPVVGRFADFRPYVCPPASVSEQLVRAIEDFPCDLLFIHRDAERETAAARRAEVFELVGELGSRLTAPHICVVPVRMSEAWLLGDDQAIRVAAGNQHGRMKLELPGVGKVERLTDPKELLYALLRLASGRTGRSLDKFRPQTCVRDVAEATEDFSHLRHLPAFALLERDVTAFAAVWATT